LAVVKIEEEGLRPIAFGDSDKARVGEWVLAVGSPFDPNLDHTVTSGIISAKGRSGVGLSRYEDFIQTDAAINPGNSGGALVNLRGELIGINTAIVTRNGGNMGIGFAIAANLAQKVTHDIVDKGGVERGWLGVHIQNVTSDLAEAFELQSPVGVLVTDVAEDSPAEEAGLRAKDVIVGFDGRAVKNAAELSTAVAGTSPGTRVTLEVIRDGETIEIDVELDKLGSIAQTSSEGESSYEDLGFSLTDIDEGVARQFDLPEDIKQGVVITDVAPGSIADRTGLRAGDVVLNVDREPVASVGDIQGIIDDAGPGDNTLLYILRGDAHLFVTCEIPEN
jgi:serine protease Do